MKETKILEEMTNLEKYKAGLKSGNAPIGQHWSRFHVRLLVAFSITHDGIMRDVYRAGPDYAHAWQLVDLGLLEPDQDPVSWDSSRASFRITVAGERMVAAMVKTCAQGVVALHVADPDGAVWR